MIILAHKKCFFFKLQRLQYNIFFYSYKPKSHTIKEKCATQTIKNLQYTTLTMR